MKKITINHVGETIYYEKLDNGMDVYLCSKEDYHNNYVTLTSKFGSVYHTFIPYGEKKEYHLPNGVAHFLEHKLFAQKEGPQPSEFFAMSGAIDNAFTTFKNTSYLFNGPNNLKENILFLLKYVQEPYFTKENVENEKGIIVQEIHMCDDQPEDRLAEAIRKTTLHNNPFRESIIGTAKEVNSVTKDMLYKCYNTFYHPSNMFLVVTGNFDIDDIMEAIKDDQRNKKFRDSGKIVLKEFKEPDKVCKKEEIINMDTEIPKVAYNIKIPIDKLGLSKREIQIYLNILFNVLFDDTSIAHEELVKDKIITSPIAVETLNCDTHFVVSLYNETKEYEKLIEKIKEVLKDIKISDKDIERKKRVIKSNELFAYENIEFINDIIIDNVVYEGKVEDNMIGIIDSVNKEKMDEIIDKIDFTNASLVVVKKK